MKQQRLSRAFGKRRQRKSGRVTRTSVLAWLQSGSTHRAAIVTRMMHLHKRATMTSAEIAFRLFRWDRSVRPDLWALLYVRRGLSDAMARGAVVHAGKRRCTETGRICVTWRVVTR